MRNHGTPSAIQENMNTNTYETVRDGNLRITTLTDGTTYAICQICHCYSAASDCTAEKCGSPVASDFAVGDAVQAKARGSLRAATVVEVKRSRLVVTYHLKTGATRTSTVSFGSFWRVA